MTVFWREGHWRTGPYGDPHWVEGHFVERDDWYRSGGLVLTIWDLVKAPIESDGCWPTRCPKCGAPVYFVRHNGGSVWLDELGWPWPKHPCFDESTSSTMLAEAPASGRWSVGVVSELQPAGVLGIAVEILCGLSRAFRGLLAGREIADLQSGQLVVLHQAQHDSAHATVYAIGDNFELQRTFQLLLFRPDSA